MDDKNLYNEYYANLIKSTSAVPLHLQKSDVARSWWTSEDSLLAKSNMPWDKKDEEEAKDEDEAREEAKEKDEDKDEKKSSHDKKGKKHKSEKEDEDEDEEGDEEDDKEEMKKSFLHQHIIEELHKAIREVSRSQEIIVHPRANYSSRTHVYENESGQRLNVALRRSDKEDPKGDYVGSAYVAGKNDKGHPVIAENPNFGVSNLLRVARHLKSTGVHNVSGIVRGDAPRSLARHSDRPSGSRYMPPRIQKSLDSLEETVSRLTGGSNDDGLTKSLADLTKITK